MLLSPCRDVNYRIISSFNAVLPKFQHWLCPFCTEISLTSPNLLMTLQHHQTLCVNGFRNYSFYDDSDLHQCFLLGFTFKENSHIENLLFWRFSSCPPIPGLFVRSPASQVTCLSILEPDAKPQCRCSL